jgi:hypothetical protein
MSPTLVETISVHELLVVGRIDNVVGEVDQQLRETAFGGCVVTEDWGEGRVSKRLGKALAQGLTSTSVVTQTESVSCAVVK